MVDEVDPARVTASELSPVRVAATSKEGTIGFGLRELKTETLVPGYSY